MKTAIGQHHRILGKINLTITYKDQTNNILLFLCPNLEQSLYLGIDLWRTFNLAPEVIRSERLQIRNLLDEYESKVDHRLNPMN